MASLKDMRVRIASTKATQKITKAMQMVAASKLRRAQAAAEAARPYAERMDTVLGNIAVVGRGARLARRRCCAAPATTRCICWSSAPPSAACAARSIPRSCGSRASAPMRWRTRARQVKFLCVGRKGFEQLRRVYEKQIVEVVELRGVRNIGFAQAADGRRQDYRAVRPGRVRRLHAVLLALQVGDLADPDRAADHPAGVRRQGRRRRGAASYEYEPEEVDILDELLPRNIAVQVFRALLENAASEQGARMSAMDNATRNAGEMIRKQTITYNRTRQAMITKELIEIISGAEAL